MKDQNMTRPIVFFTTYFLSPDQQRQNEINFCVFKNLENKLFSRLFFFTETESERTELKKIFEKNQSLNAEIISLNRVPTYFDWLRLAAERCVQADVIFSNADIFFNETVQFLSKYLLEGQKLICLSRHDRDEEGFLTLHSKPHWSQDAWALRADNIHKINFFEELKFSSGKPRCDNRLAYLFTVWGWKLFNPCNEIQAVHVHSSKVRNYEYTDLINIGTVAYVHPSFSDVVPSEIDFSIFTLGSESLRRVEINSFLEKKLKTKS